jgi:sugar phosphate isomerase/epimerase
LLHLKDLRPGAPRDASGTAKPEDDVAVGSGEIAWDPVFAAARAAGIEYSFLEDESAAPLENIPRSLRYLAQSTGFQQI